MWKSALSYVMSNTNYTITNINNLYNLIVAILDMGTEEQNIQIIDSIILHMGRTFYRDFKLYVFQKIPNSKHMTLMNRII
jgi:hypothetical protein